jgi:hypothetical protein
MQEHKELTPKMLYQVHIGDLVPKDNFYRILDKELHLRYDIDKQLPWHSTINRMRSLYGEEVFRSYM